MNKKFDKNDILKKIPANGFTKLTSNGKNDLKTSDRVFLNRKGNQFFNEGKVDAAKRIFLTTGYSDGLIRVGDYYYDNNNYVEALKMYTLAPSTRKKDELIEKISLIIKDWIK